MEGWNDPKSKSLEGIQGRLVDGKNIQVGENKVDEEVECGAGGWTERPVVGVSVQPAPVVPAGGPRVGFDESLALMVGIPPSCTPLWGCCPHMPGCWGCCPRVPGCGGAARPWGCCPGVPLCGGAVFRCLAMGVLPWCALL